MAAGAADGLQDELGYPVYFLDFDPKSYAEYYDVVSNRMLWFAVHCLWDEMGVKEFGDREVAAWDDAYQPINERFARPYWRSPTATRSCSSRITTSRPHPDS